MSFVDPVYVVFLAVVFSVNWALAGHLRAQNLWLLLASLTFYGWIHPWMVGLLLGSALLDYVAALGITRDQAAGGTGGRWMALSAIGNVGALAGFKYFNFFEAAFVAALQKVGFDAHPTTMQVFLPIGLSFYTFQTMAYTIDVWRKQLTARNNLVDFLVFVALFPQLVAGPVERASNLLAQVEAPRRFNLDQVTSGLSLALFGAFKKVVIADTMAPYVNILYQAESPSWTMIWAACLGFSIQVLADFSGYTDMARGSARMLGFELMENFRHPYLASSPMDFWTRWHISFSTWLRDYVYLPSCFSPWVDRWIRLPFVGELSPFWVTARALLITMFLSGLWHGSTWNYIVWGLYYAVIGTVWAGIYERIPRKTRKQRDWRPILVPVMFVHTLVGMQIFREPDLARLWSHLTTSPFTGTADQHIVAVGMLAMCAAGAAPLLLALAWEQRVAPKLAASPLRLPVQTTAWAVCAVLLVTFYRSTNNDFVYFQF